jgi:hypothetical protein
MYCFCSSHLTSAWISLFLITDSLSLSLSLSLEHRASVKRFVSLEFLNPKRIGRTPWTGDHPVARPLPTQTQNKRTQTSMPWVGFEPMIPAFERGQFVS